MFGRKVLFIIGMAGFTISLLIAGFATNAIYMDVFSGVLGLFAAAVVPPAVGALGAVYEKPSKRKNLAFACFSAGNPLGFVGGMIISGVASYCYNWRASFWAHAVVYAIFTVLTVWTVPADGFARTPFGVAALKKFDLLGTALIVVGFALFSSSLSYVPLVCLFIWGFADHLPDWRVMLRMAGERDTFSDCLSWDSSFLLHSCIGSLLQSIL
jgi:MFS family permease